MKPGSSIVNTKKGDGFRHRTIKHFFIDEDFSDENLEKSFDDLEDDDLDGLVNGVTDDDVMDLYDPEDFAFVDEDGNKIEDLEDGEKEPVDEVLSRQGRIKAKMRFRMSKSKRLRSAKLALHKRSSTDRLNKKAMRLASRTLKMKIAKKDLAKLSIAEKERLERMMSKKHTMVQRLAKKMVNRIRTIENKRLSHKGYTK